MSDIHHFLNGLKDPNKSVRLDACEQLGHASALSQKAVFALTQALDDPDLDVASAALRVLQAHGYFEANSNSESDSNSRRLPNFPETGRRPSLIGNLAINHWLFLIVGTGMIIGVTASGNWGTLLFVMLFFLGCIALTGGSALNSQKKLTEAWSELAVQTGLKLDAGRRVLFGNSTPPGICGTYRGRLVTVSKVVHHEDGYEGSIPVVFTRTSLRLFNPGNCTLVVTSQPFYKRIFKSGGVTSGNQTIDKRFQFEGHPDWFLRKVLRWIVYNPDLLDPPHNFFMRTDYPLAFTTWRPPSIQLEGSQLTYLQSGISSDVPAQVRILNLLCDLADLTMGVDRVLEVHNG